MADPVVINIDVSGIIAAINSSATTIAGAINDHAATMTAASTNITTALASIQDSAAAYSQSTAATGVIDEYWTQVGQIETQLANVGFALDKIEPRIYQRLLAAKQQALDSIITNAGHTALTSQMSISLSAAEVTVGSQIIATVTVLDSSNNAVAGQIVGFTVDNGKVVLSDGAVISDATGIARTRIIGMAVGSDIIRVTIPTNASISATANFTVI